MTHSEWLVRFKECRQKFWDAQRDVYDTSIHAWRHTGHALCGLRYITGRRCMFRTCPLRDTIRGTS